ncbi:MAG: hypothetical protein HYX75_16480 [Acidobacteria bacterium]|nr:hypothetical protein [Acidobacteriota bacterium]
MITGACFIAFGAWAILAQALFLRESLIVFFGNELALGVALASWFLGIFAGAACAGFRPPRSAPPARRAAAFAIPFVLLIVSFPLGLLALRASRLFLGVPGGELVPLGRVSLVCLLTITSSSFLVGWLFPAASAVAAATRWSGRGAIGWVYVLESGGGLIGGVAFTALFLPRFPAMVAVGVFASVALASITLLLRVERHRGWMISALMTILLFVALCAGWPRSLDEWMAGVRWQSYRNTLPLVLSLDSPYENIAVAGDGPVHLFLNGQVAGTFPDPYGYATRVHPLMLQHPHPEAILLLGGGMTGMAREILRHPVRRLDIAEADPWLPGVLERFLPPDDRDALRDPRVALHSVDPRRFVADSTGTYDIIILSFPDPTTAALNRFYTREFFCACRMLLDKRGILITRVTSSSNYLGGAALGLPASIYWSLRDVFANVLATPGEECYLVASGPAGAPSLDPNVLSSRHRERNIETPMFQPELLEVLFPEDRVAFVRSALESAADTPRNTDLRPVSYFYGLLLWDRFSGGEYGYSLGRLAERPLSHWVLALALPCAAWAAFVLTRARPRRLRLQTLTAIGSTGSASIAWSLLLLLVFQDIFGYLYQEVALLVALFMSGLATGAEVARRHRAGTEDLTVRWRALRHSDIASFVFSCVLLTTLPLLVKAGSGWPAWAAIATLLLLAGVTTGAQFAAASSLYQHLAGDVRVAAGAVDAADHLGAALGALATGVLLVPLLGLAGTALIVAVLKAASLTTQLRGAA